MKPGAFKFSVPHKVFETGIILKGLFLFLTWTKHLRLNLLLTQPNTIIRPYT